MNFPSLNFQPLSKNHFPTQKEKLNSQEPTNKALKLKQKKRKKRCKKYKTIPYHCTKQYIRINNLRLGQFQQL